MPRNSNIIEHSLPMTSIGRTNNPWQTIHKQHNKEKLSNLLSITKTCLYNFDPFKPNFYIVKQGFTGVYLFLISAQKHRLWVLVRTALLNVLTRTHCFEQIYEKMSEFLSENFHILVVKVPVYMNRRVFVISSQTR